MNQQTASFYQKNIEELKGQFHQKKQQLNQLSFFRFAAFLGTVFLVYLGINSNVTLFWGVLAGLVIFIYLVIKHRDVKWLKDIIEAKLTLNKNELKILKERKFDFLPDGSEFIDPSHAYSHDIDLFGKRSFFQFINRTATPEGAVQLAKCLTENSTQSIVEKQKAIQELSEKTVWRQHYTAIASLVTTSHTILVIERWMVTYRKTLSTFFSWFTSMFSSVSVVLIAITAFQLIPFSILILWFFGGLAMTMLHLKKINTLYENSSKAKDTIKQYHLLLELIETETFTSTYLKQHQEKIQEESEKASVIFKKFSRALDALDQRNNIIVALLGNGLFLLDIHNAFRIEKWLENYQHKVMDWFATIAVFDAQNSLGNFAFNHPTYSFPKLTDKATIISAKGLGHPLLKPEQCVTNDLQLDTEEFFIVTGANMAGKSTFLRTVSLSIVMANIGLPVCAETFVYRPIKLVTSMRTSDSLSEDESYFYSELKRLKYIVNLIKTDNYFIVLDEILKGTNSKDKAIGSKKFVERLVRSNSSGIIATHDISLCELEQELDEVKNYFFEAQIIANELFFDYEFKKGICTNMNASFLLKHMGIV